MDGLALYAVTRELQVLCGGRLDKLNQPERDEITLTVRAGGENKTLLISASPDNARVQLTGTKRANPMEAPAFLMLLRRRLTGGRITGVMQPRMDRRIEILIEARDELGDRSEYRLIAEIMGRFSNIILVDGNGRVVDAVRRVTSAMTEYRSIFPGERYVEPPPQEKTDPREAEYSDVLAAISAGNGARSITNAFFGIAPDTARELLIKADDGTDETNEAKAKAITDMLKAFVHEGFTPCLLTDAVGKPTSVLPFHPKDRNYIPFESMEKALDELFAMREAVERRDRKTSSVRKRLSNNIERCEKKLAIYQDAIDSADDAEKLRLFGELITANLPRLTKGMAEALLDDYYQFPPEPIKVRLDPLLTPNENAQRYYKKYRKSKTARDMALSMHGETKSELDYLIGALDDLEKCVTDAEIAELCDELLREGYIKPDRSKQKRPKLPPSEPMRYTAQDGTAILIGKNNRQNDELTLHTAAPDDIWLHTKDIPGSHVIIRTDGKEVRPETLRFAAQLAAFYSHAGMGDNVPVDYCARRYVKKPSGSKPGMVIFTNNKTVWVKPSDKIEDDQR